MSSMPMALPVGVKTEPSRDFTAHPIFDFLNGMSQIYGQLTKEMVRAYAVRDPFLAFRGEVQKPFDRVLEGDGSLNVTIGKDYPLLLEKTVGRKGDFLSDVGLEPLCISLLGPFATRGNVARTANYFSQVRVGDNISVRVENAQKVEEDIYRVFLRTTNHSNRDENNRPKEVANHDYFIKGVPGEGKAYGGLFGEILLNYGMDAVQPAVRMEDLISKRKTTSNLMVLPTEVYGWGKIFRHITPHFLENGNRTPIAESSLMATLLLSSYSASVRAQMPNGGKMVKSHLCADYPFPEFGIHELHMGTTKREIRVEERHTRIESDWIEGILRNMMGQLGNFSMHLESRRG